MTAEALQRAERAAQRAARVIATFGTVAMLAVAGAIMADVLSRWFVGSAFSGLNEIVSLIFALGMGFVGGFLPAARAARMKIVDALRAA